MYTTLVSPVTLKALLNNSVIVDCRFDLAQPEAGRMAYQEGHIPGAFYLHLEEELSGLKTGHNGRHPLPNREDLIRTFRKYGVSDTTQVVVYDAQGSMFAARVWWLLRWLGHQAVAVLDGGIQRWCEEGYPLTGQLSVAAKEGELSVRMALQSTLSVQDIEANLHNKSFLLVDARSPDRFKGENETIDPVGGHIPGAVNRFFKHNLHEDGTFKSPQRLKEEWAKVLESYNPAQTVHQCGSGVTACHNLLALEIAGLVGGKLYPGSWSEWCSIPRPIEH